MSAELQNLGRDNEKEKGEMAEELENLSKIINLKAAEEVDLKKQKQLLIIQKAGLKD